MQAQSTRLMHAVNMPAQQGCTSASPSLWPEPGLLDGACRRNLPEVCLLNEPERANDVVLDSGGRGLTGVVRSVPSAGLLASSATCSSRQPEE